MGLVGCAGWTCVKASGNVQTHGRQLVACSGWGAGSSNAAVLAGTLQQHLILPPMPHHTQPPTTHDKQQEGVINAVPGCTQQLVLTTLGDGNCLSHACSLGVWGIHDRDGLLRGAIAATMTHPAAGAAIRERFFRQLQRNGIPQVPAMPAAGACWYCRLQ